MKNFPNLPSTPASTVETTHKTSVRIARELADYISDSQMSEGTKLPTEVEMARRLGVGRTTLREALRLLELRGVISIRVGRGGGPVVRQPRTTDLAEGLALVLQFQRATLSDVVEARLILEPAAARQAASKATPQLLLDLRDTVETMLSEPTPGTFSRENARFHSLIANTLGNPVISVYIDCLKRVHDGRPSGIEYATRHIQAVSRAHLAIIDALEARDSDASEAAMRKHLEDTKGYWTRKYRDAYHQPLRWSDGE